MLLAWIAGGIVSLIGALCYAELAPNYPHVGGNYYYLQRAYGNAIAFLFAWARMTVVQTRSIALLLIILGILTRKGFEAMVDYTAPVFWFFFLLVGIALFILRSQEPLRDNAFRVPFYPITPILFCLICGYLLYSSLVYVKAGAIAGVLVLALEIPVLYQQKRQVQ